MQNGYTKSVAWFLLVVGMAALAGNSYAGDKNKTIKIDNLQVLPNCREAKAGGPEKVVRSLFDRFKWGSGDIPDHQSRKVMAEFFVPSLVELLQKLKESELDRSPNAPSYPSMPEIWNRPTYDIEEMTEFRVCAMDPRQNYVRVQFRNGGSPEIVLYKLEKAGSDWKISDVVFVVDYDPADPDASEGWSLMDTLSDYYAATH